MKHADIKAMMAEIAPVIREYTASALAPLVARLDDFERRLASIPAPKDGKGISDIDLNMTDEGKTMVLTFTVGDIERSFEVALPDGVKGEPGENGKPGRDGLDVKDMLRAEGNRLIAVLSDGSTKDLGVFVGKDGNDGNPGRDGMGFDDMKHEIREEGVYLVWERDGVTKEAFMPVPFYRGVWSKDAGYRAGNNVTWGGSTWIATKDGPSGKPDAPDSDWMLSNKRGRDGKDAPQ